MIPFDLARFDGEPERFRRARCNEPWLNLNKRRVAWHAPKTLRLAVEAGEIEGIILCRMVRGSSADQRSANRRLSASFIARAEPKLPRGSHPDQPKPLLSNSHR